MLLKFFFFKAKSLGNLILFKKGFYGNPISKRAQPANYQTIEANVIGNI